MVNRGSRALFALVATLATLPAAVPAAAATVVAPAGLAAGPTAVALGTGPTFDSANGRVKATFRSTSVGAGYAITFVENRNAIVAGTADGDFALARIVAHVGDGFGGDTLVTSDFGQDDDTAFGVDVSPDGHVTAVGASGGNLAVARYERFGNLDWSFDGDGKVVRDLGGVDDAGLGVVAMADGTSVVVGGNSSTAIVLKFRADGSLDPAFGTGGTVPQAASARGAPWPPRPTVPCWWPAGTEP